MTEDGTILPAAFVEMLRSAGRQSLAALPEVLAATAPEVSVRLNRLKYAGAGSVDKTVAGLAPSGRVAWWADGGVYLPGRPLFTLDPAMHQGLYYVQEASSMMLGNIVGQLARRIGDSVAAPLYLDACAAPGGKSSLALEALPPQWVVVANEYAPARASVLCETLAKQGSGRAVVTRGDAAAYGDLGPAFDIIAADAPCSGEGMMRKDPVAVGQWSEALTRQCAATQLRIVDSLWQALRPGGYMIYSTCTFNRRENEDIVAHLVDDLGAEPVEDLDWDETWGIEPGLDGSRATMRFTPGRTRGEGLFMAVVRRPREGEASDRPAPRPAREKRRGSDPVAAGTLAQLRARYADCIEGGDSGLWTLDTMSVTGAAGNASLTLRHAPEAVADAARRVSRVARLLTYGTEVATVMTAARGSVTDIPSQPLALSASLRPGAFAGMDVERDDALAYLRRQAIADIPDTLPRGYLLLSYGGHPLGFVKNVGRRANNLYPAQWRIMMADR